MLNFNFNSSIETERLLLRPMHIDDCVDVVRWRNSKRVRETFESEAQYELTLDKQIKWFTETRNTRLDFVVIEKNISKKIGVWSFKKFKPEIFYNYAEQGRYIGEESALGKGYAKEIAPAWLRFGFEHLGALAVVGIHKIDNKIPQNINMKMGFTYFDVPGLRSDLVAMKIDRDQFNYPP
jgi:RimJ/RimL family protein N-acetyltransferase